MTKILSQRRVLAAMAALAMGVFTGCIATSEKKPSAADGLSLRSPDGAIGLTLSVQGALTYAVTVDGRPMVLPSKLGLQFNDGTVLGRDVRLLRIQGRNADSTWENPWGKRRRVRDQYRELRLVLREKTGAGRDFEVVFRAYNDGVAFRYCLL